MGVKGGFRGWCRGVGGSMIRGLAGEVADGRCLGGVCGGWGFRAEGRG